MTDRTRSRLAIGLLLLAGTSVFWWWLTDEPVTTGVDQAATTPQSQPPAHEATRLESLPGVSGATSPPAALPPSGTPLSESVGPLQALADAGSSQAACRLGIELLRCIHLEASKNVRSWDGLPMDESLARHGQLDAADQWAEIRIHQIKLRKQCSSVPPALLKSAPHYLAAAARAGEPEAMLRYAAGTHHGGNGSHAFARDPDFVRWRRDAPAMALRALHSGRLEAVELLATAYRADYTPFAALIPNDPVQARAYNLLRARISGLDPSPSETLDAGLEDQARGARQ